MSSLTLRALRVIQTSVLESSLQLARTAPITSIHCQPFAPNTSTPMKAVMKMQ